MKFEEENGINVLIEHRCGVYFLIDGEEVVYVGQSQNCFYRVGARFADKKFDKVVLLPFMFEDLDYFEDYYIKKYKPKYNKISNYNMNYAIDRVRKELKENLKISLSSFKIIYLSKKLNINIYNDQFTYKPTIRADGFTKLFEFVNDNYKELCKIKEKSNESNKKFAYYIDLYFEKGNF